MKAIQWKIVLLLIVSGIGYYFISFHIERHWYELLFGTIAVLFMAYFFITKIDFKIFTFKQWLVIAMLLRMIFLFSTPNLSDDYHRFIWDGLCTQNNISPFEYVPSEMPENKLLISSETQLKLVNEMNSPNYYSVYPPVLQSVFYLSAKFFGEGNYAASIFIMKFFLLLMELVSLIYIRKILIALNLETKNWMLYAFNPLIIIEFVGNIHFEGAMIAFLAVSIYYFIHNKWKGSAFFMAFAVMSKLIPLMLLPYFWYQMGFVKGLKYMSLLAIVLVLGFVPFIDFETLSNMSQSLYLYFQTFEFNASLYYIFRWMGYQIYGHNMIAVIGILLSILTLGLVLWQSFQKQNSTKNLMIPILWIFMIHLSMATIVHPWYLGGLIFAGIFTQYRFPLVWSGMIFLSYFTYRDTTYTESLILVFIEYAVVFGFLVWEWKYKNDLKTLSSREDLISG